IWGHRYLELFAHQLAQRFRLERLGVTPPSENPPLGFDEPSDASAHDTRTVCLLLHLLRVLKSLFWQKSCQVRAESVGHLDGLRVGAPYPDGVAKEAILVEWGMIALLLVDVVSGEHACELEGTPRATIQIPGDEVDMVPGHAQRRGIYHAPRGGVGRRG